ncbi:hypothetical protein ABGB18_09165 [Nonomuraea sp. B12E4]|uniref:hypothetical protein n=1 Tax=Nonomuraea sp. B12E4 TaxID=3153564 RepID=UPI00325F081A
MQNMTQVPGGKDDFQLVHHLTLKGSRFEIGRALAEEARRLGWAPTPGDPVVNRARRTWFERHWPQHHARMDGAAAILGDGPLCVTNHLLHRHPDPMNLPEDTELSFRTFERLRTLHERSKGVTMSPRDLRETLRSVRPREDPATPFRTMWTTVFDTADRTLSTSFYLGDGRRYTEELVFPGHDR